MILILVGVATIFLIIGVAIAIKLKRAKTYENLLRSLFPIITIDKIKHSFFGAEMEGLWREERLKIAFIEERASLVFSLAFYGSPPSLHTLLAQSGDSFMPPLTILKSNGKFLIKTGLKMGFLPKYTTVITEDKIESVRIEEIKTFFSPDRNAAIHALFHAGFKKINVFKDRVAIEASPHFLGGTKGVIFAKKDVFTLDNIPAILEEIQKFVYFS